MIGIYRFKPKKDQMINGLASWLIQCGISANQITLVGLILGILAIPFLSVKLFSVGLPFMALSLFADMLDGALARLLGSNSLSGKLLDAFCDRVVEVSWVGALFCNGMLPWWGWLMPLGSIGLFLARYIAFRQSIDTTFVPITRFERVTAIFGMILIPWRWVNDSIYLIVVGGTAVSIILILCTIYQKNNDYPPTSERKLGIETRPL